MEEQLITALINELALKLGGVAIIVSGLTAFLGTLYINRQREKDRNESEKSIHIYKAQFEKEFESYQKIWKQINNLHSKLGIFLRSIDHEENIESNRKECRETLYNTQSIANELVPFIDKSIENIMFESIDIYSNIHLSACVYLDGNQQKDLDMIKLNEKITKEHILNKYNNAYSKTCSNKLHQLAIEIRKRITSLSVI